MTDATRAVDRWEFASTGWDECGCHIEREPEGVFVLFVDYEHLTARLARLEGALREIAALPTFDIEDGDCLDYQNVHIIIHHALGETND